MLDVREVVCFFTTEQDRTLTHFWLESVDIPLTARKCGAARRWFFMCPACSRLYEHLYVPPGEPCSPSAQVGQFAAIEEERVFGSS